MKKILIVSLRAGMGHIKSAQALKEAGKKIMPRTKIEAIDLMDYSLPNIKLGYGDLYIEIAKRAPDLYSFFYKTLYSMPEAKLHALIDKLSSRKFLKYLKNFAPDVLICTNFVPAKIAEYYRKENNLNFPIVVTVTDFEAHPLWLVDKADLYAVASEEIKYYLTQKGVDPNKIIISGIPVGMIFSVKKPRAILRKKHNFDEKLPIIAISAGAFGVVSVKDVIKKIDLLPYNFQILAICGNNKGLLKDLEKESFRKDVKIVGYTDFMDEIMQISDLFISKPGGITVSESLAKELPLLIYQPIPGQEEANSDYLLEQGAALKARNLESVVYKVGQFLRDGLIKRRLLKNIKRIREPNSSLKIMKYVKNKFLKI